MSTAGQRQSRSTLSRSIKPRLTTAMAGALVLLAVNNVPHARAEMQMQGVELLEATIPQLQAALMASRATSRDLVAMYLARIDAYDQRGPTLNAVSVTNANALTEADARDAERRAGTPASTRQRFTIRRISPIPPGRTSPRSKSIAIPVRSRC